MAAQPTWIDLRRFGFSCPVNEFQLYDQEGKFLIKVPKDALHSIKALVTYYFIKYIDMCPENTEGLLYYFETLIPTLVQSRSYSFSLVALEISTDEEQTWVDRELGGNFRIDLTFNLSRDDINYVSYINKHTRTRFESAIKSAKENLICDE